jgi:hypothetical protein
MHGIPFQLIVDTPDGPTNETAYFPTIRRFPQLRRQYSCLRSATTQLQIAAKIRSIAEDSLESAASMEDARKAADALVQADDALASAEAALSEASRAFVLEGLSLAGHPKDDAERIHLALPPRRIAELVSIATLGLPPNPPTAA